MGFFLDEAFDDGDEPHSGQLSSEELLRRIAQQDERIRELQRIVSDLQRATALRAVETIREPMRAIKEVGLPALPAGVPVIAHTYGSLYGGREHPDPDGEYSALPLSDGTLLSQGERYSRPE